MSITSSLGANFGFYTQSSYNGPNLAPSLTKQIYSVRENMFSDDNGVFNNIEFNIFQILGYIPVLSSGTAVARIMCVSDNPVVSAENLTIVKVIAYIRAFFEILGLGVIFLPVDLLVTLVRFTCCQEKQLSYAPEPT
ncbi:MAG: hypothetical protein JSS62_03585 [Verrucomicrobia bacterium]|nr:hypothetical protein [Verrucomicrobiota bacterium]MBS0645078.1 hypothetical protein [Verrucomicrobiota bacterium]